MKHYRKTTPAQLLLALIAVFFVLIFTPGCSSNAVNATVKELWSGVSQTHALDSVKYYTAGDTAVGYTDGTGKCSFQIAYTSGPVITEACGNNEICGMVFNQPYAKFTDDNSLLSPTFNILALGGSSDTIPVKVWVTDLAGNPHINYSVQFKLGGSDYGTAGTTNSNGAVVYGTGLNQGTVYTVTASSSTGSSNPLTVSTIPAAGTSGNFTYMVVYIRY